MQALSSRFQLGGRLGKQRVDERGSQYLDGGSGTSGRGEAGGERRNCQCARNFPVQPGPDPIRHRRCTTSSWAVGRPLGPTAFPEWKSRRLSSVASSPIGARIQGPHRPRVAMLRRRQDCTNGTSAQEVRSRAHGRNRYGRARRTDCAAPAEVGGVSSSSVRIIRHCAAPSRSTRNTTQ